MTEPIFALLLGLSQGLIHGLGPDHCAAIATLGAGSDRKSTLRTALRFAIGHALALGSVAALCLGAGVALSESFERWAETFGGALLLALALAALFFPGALRHGHPHWPGHGRDHGHGRMSTAAGALMAISGTRSLLLSLTPLLVGGGLSARGLAYLPGFALGILLAMGGFGLLVSEGFARLGERAASLAHRAVAVSSAALGLFWMAEGVGG